MNKHLAITDVLNLTIMNSKLLYSMKKQYMT